MAYDTTTAWSPRLTFLRKTTACSSQHMCMDSRSAWRNGDALPCSDFQRSNATTRRTTFWWWPKPRKTSLTDWYRSIRNKEEIGFQRRMIESTRLTVRARVAFSCAMGRLEQARLWQPKLNMWEVLTVYEESSKLRIWLNRFEAGARPCLPYRHPPRDTPLKLRGRSSNSAPTPSELHPCSPNEATYILVERSSKLTPSSRKLQPPQPRWRSWSIRQHSTARSNVRVKATTTSSARATRHWRCAGYGMGRIPPNVECKLYNITTCSKSIFDLWRNMVGQAYVQV